MASILTVVMLMIVLNMATSEDASAASQDQVIHHEVKIENLTHFIMNSTIELHIHEGTNASEIRQAYDVASSDNKSAMIAAIQEAVSDEAMDALRTMFNGSYAFNTSVEINLSSMDNGLGPEVPIHLWGNSSADLSRTSYDLPPQAVVEDVVFGTLNMGAVIKLDVVLIAPSNSTVTYVFTPPPGTIIEEHTTGMHGMNNVTWVLNNTAGFAPEMHEHLRLRSEFPNAVHDEDIQVTMVIDRKQFTAPAY